MKTKEREIGVEEDEEVVDQGYGIKDFLLPNLVL
jgi:hypothetical protein